MAPLKLYGLPMSTPTAAIRICLAEKELEYEFIHVDLFKGEHKSPSFLSKNPFGKIPVLEDGHITIFESRAILAYLAHKYKDNGPDLYRHDNIEEAAMVGVWAEVESNCFNEPISLIIFNKIIAPVIGQPSDQSVIDANVEKLGGVLDVYETRLSKSKYLACASFTLADLQHIPYIYYFMKTPWTDLINSRPHVKAWWEDISARPSFLKVAPGLSFGA